MPQFQSFGLTTSKLFRGEGGRISVSAARTVAQASTATTQENVLDWVKKDKRRMLHVVYRVGDMDRTIKYVFCIQSSAFDLGCCFSLSKRLA